MLTRRSLAAIAAVLLIGLSTAAVAEPLRLLRDEGWIVDDRYGKKHANPDSRDAVLRAIEAGEPLVYWSIKQERYYPIADQEKAKAFIARRVEIIGNVLPDGTLRIGTYRPIEREGN